MPASAVRCELPGGAWHDGVRVRDAVLRPLDGTLERAFAEIAERAPSWTEFVTSLLTAGVERIGTRTATERELGALSVADRQWLLLRLTQAVHGDSFWVTARCAGCRARFDLRLERSALPVKAGGAGFPFAEVPSRRGTLRARVPDGDDQVAVADMEEPSAIARLADRCIVAIDGAPRDGEAIALDAEELDAIDDALDEVAASVGLVVATTCPECERPHEVEVDPFGAVDWGAARFEEEVHVLARTYHWSEDAILALSRHRRRRYLDLIRRDGMDA